MDASNSPPGGSRWEPGAGGPDAPSPTGPVSAGDDDAPTRPRRGRRRTFVVAAMVGLIAVGGLGAAAVGHAVSDGPGIGHEHHGHGGGPRDGARSGGAPAPDGTLPQAPAAATPGTAGAAGTAGAVGLPAVVSGVFS